jgi:phospholipid transport system substrate-binding protein
MVTVWLTAVAQTATDALESRDRQIRTVIPSKGNELTATQRQKIEDTVGQLVDFEGVAKASLGKHWDEEPLAKRQKFMQVFTRRFKKAAAEQVDFFRSTQTKFGKERPEGDDVMVPSTVTIKGEPTDVDYRMRQLAGAWRIEDIVVDEVSTVEDYRSAFAKIISENGFDGLISRLEKGQPAKASEQKKH